MTRRPLTYADIMTSNLPPVNYKWELFDEVIKKCIANVDYLFEKKKGLLIWGEVKTGKTASVVAIGKEALRRGFSVYYLQAYDFINEKEDLSPYLFESVDFFIFDDFDFVDKGSYEYLRNIFKKRITIAKINILTAKDKDIIFRTGFDFLKEYIIPIQLEKVVDDTIVTIKQGNNYVRHSEKSS